MTTNTKEQGLESIIVAYLRDVNGYVEGTSELYDKMLAIVPSWLEAFLVATQPDKVARSMCFAFSHYRRAGKFGIILGKGN